MESNDDYDEFETIETHEFETSWRDVAYHAVTTAGWATVAIFGFRLIEAVALAKFGASAGLFV